VSDVVLTPSPGITVEGRVQFEGGMPPPEQLSGLRIALAASLAPNEINIGAPPSAVDGNASFKLAGVTPGRYSLELSTADGPAVSLNGWWLKSASIGGRDAAEATIELSTSNISDAVVVLTRSVASISGAVLDAGGAPAMNEWVVVFPADRGLWTPKSRRCNGTMTPASGRYQIGPLPAGDYFIATARGLEYRDWFNPAVLDRLSAGAVRVTLTEGEQKSLDLRVPRR
jgi:hypothetical protein